MFKFFSLEKTETKLYHSAKLSIFSDRWPQNSYILLTPEGVNWLAYLKHPGTSP